MVNSVTPNILQPQIIETNTTMSIKGSVVAEQLLLSLVGVEFCKNVLEKQSVTMLKQFSPSLKASKLDRGSFRRISNQILNSSKTLVPTFINAPEIISSALDKMKCFVSIFASN